MKSMETRRNTAARPLFYPDNFWLGREGSNLRMVESKSTACRTARLHAGNCLREFEEITVKDYLPRGLSGRVFFGANRSRWRHKILCRFVPVLCRGVFDRGLVVGAGIHVTHCQSGVFS